MTFVASANAVAYTGATPYFVDVLEEDGNLDPTLLAEAIQDVRAGGRRVGAVMSVDLLGKAANYTAITEICERFDVPLIEDAAEALGAAHAGRPAGQFGAAAVLSFNGNKVMTTSGGGMLVSDDEALASHARFLSTQAREPFAHYEHEHIGYNYRMSNILAALGRAQLVRLDSMIERRRQIRRTYADLAETLAGVRVFGREDDTESNCWLSALVLDPANARTRPDQLLAALDAADIEARPLWKPMHAQPLFKDAPRLERGVSDRLFAQGVALPSGSVLSDQQVSRVCDVLDRELGDSSMSGANLRIAITGGHGFLGWHTAVRYRAKHQVNVTLAGRQDFADVATLSRVLAGADTIIHLAGVNRADSAEAVEEGNVEIARTLAESHRNQWTSGARGLRELDPVRTGQPVRAGQVPG